LGNNPFEELTLLARWLASVLSSIAGCESINAPVAYSVAKPALQSAMKCFSRLAGPQEVRINSVVPGNVLFPDGTWERKIAEQRKFFD
jgi:3-oxoacyl-[acyl-carrier protein] reductase